MEYMKSENKIKSQRIDSLIEENKSLNIEFQASKSQITLLETKCSSLELELKLSNEENTRLKESLSEKNKLIEELKKSAEELLVLKDSQKNTTSEKLKELEKGLAEKSLSYDAIVLEHQELKLALQENTTLKYQKEEQINTLSAQFQQSEELRKKLQENLLSSKKKVDDVLQSQINKENEKVQILLIIVYSYVFCSSAIVGFNIAKHCK